jgi:hypothetical protein
MIDRTTKTILAGIALGLFASAIIPLLRPAHVAATDAFTCDGKLNASPLGTSYPGGYSIKMACQ